jgi:hypothetical protein
MAASLAEAFQLGIKTFELQVGKTIQQIVADFSLEETAEALHIPPGSTHNHPPTLNLEKRQADGGS